MSDDDRRRHLYILGQTGTGKSTLLGNMIIEDIQAGKGLAIIDPHGDLAENALGFVPKERLDDVIYFNPGDLERPMGLNMLDYNFDRPEEKTFIVNEIQSIFNKLFPPETMGPMFEQYMRNALLLLICWLRAGRCGWRDRTVAAERLPSGMLCGRTRTLAIPCALWQGLGRLRRWTAP